MSSIALSASASGSESGSADAVDRGRFALVGLGTVVAAVTANVVVYVLGSALVGYDPRFLPLAKVDGVVLFTLLPAIVATLLYALLLRFSGNPPRTFGTVSAVVFVVTLIPDFAYIPTVPGASSGQTAILVLMHVVAAGVIVGTLTGFARPHSCRA